MTTLQELEAQARQVVEGVANDPQGRYALREAFYKKYGHAIIDGYGYGNSELAFMRWEMERGVLNPITGSSPGSPWWRDVNLEFMYYSELGALIHENSFSGTGIPAEAQNWVDYINSPCPESWYKAHNSCIVRGYLDCVPQAKAESSDEQFFMNEVLYRLLFAEAMVMGKEFGEVGEIAADPRLPAVDLITSMHAFYPINYPMSAQDKLNIHHLGHSLQDRLAAFFDEDIILPHIESLYQLVATTIDEPGLLKLVSNGQPIYPDITQPPPPATPRKIAILGSGMAALSAAYQLSKFSGWQQYYEIHVYEMGWRCGGKTATGRGPNSRIQEHGIHILQGWYVNAFRLLDQVYQERKSRGIDPQSPWQVWTEAFERNNGTMLTEYIGDTWYNWPLIFPETDQLPGSVDPPTIWDELKILAGLALEMLFGSPYQTNVPAWEKWIMDHFLPPDGNSRTSQTIGEEVKGWLQGLLGKTQEQQDEEMGQVVRSHVAALPEGTASLAIIKDILGGVLEALKFERFFKDHRLRHIVLMLELIFYNVVGIINDVYKPGAGGHPGTFDFKAINGKDYRQWLMDNGAGQDIAYFTPVRFLYTGMFSNLADGMGKGGAIEAGQGLQTLLTAGGYKGSFVWQFKGGTGDTLVMPVYQVLKARGVNFHFFSLVEEIEPATSGDTIASFTVGTQVDLKPGVSDYDPSIRVGELTAWPAEPNYGQLDPTQAAELQAKDVDLENPWSDWSPVSSKTLTAGTDFDDIVLAIPVGALGSICGKLAAAKPAWANMVGKIKTTMTQSVQLWFSPTIEQLGWIANDWGMANENCAGNTVVFQNPLYSWLDSSVVLPWEAWPAGNKANTVIYYTGSLQDPTTIPPFSDHHYPKRLHDQLEATATQWLWDNMGWFFKQATTPAAPRGIDLNLLVDPAGTGRTAKQKMASQWFKVAMAPWERYVLAVPGSNQYRLKTDASGYSNLFLAGDWIDYGLNVGHVDGAITAGLQAGSALRQKYGLTDMVNEFAGIAVS